jgi:hypothetical protein
MGFAIVSLEVSFEKAQRVDPRAATFTDGSPLLGIANGNFLEHRCDQ